MADIIRGNVDDNECDDEFDEKGVVFVVVVVSANVILDAEAVVNAPHRRDFVDVDENDENDETDGRNAAAVVATYDECDDDRTSRTMTISSSNATKDDDDDGAWTEEEAGAGKVGGTTTFPPRGCRARTIVEGVEVCGELRADHNSRLKIAEVGEDFEHFELLPCVPHIRLVNLKLTILAGAKNLA